MGMSGLDWDLDTGTGTFEGALKQFPLFRPFEGALDGLPFFQPLEGALKRLALFRSFEGALKGLPLFRPLEGPLEWLPHFQPLEHRLLSGEMLSSVPAALPAHSAPQVVRSAKHIN